MVRLIASFIDEVHRHAAARSAALRDEAIDQRQDFPHRQGGALREQADVVVVVVADDVVAGVVDGGVGLAGGGQGVSECLRDVDWVCLGLAAENTAAAVYA